MISHQYKSTIVAKREVNSIILFVPKIKRKNLKEKGEIVDWTEEEKLNSGFLKPVYENT